ncbi:MAG TPA: class I SAM-dependent methyltransferase [Tepidisphaeraceae bacterium]|jgi:23S rRNA (cytosine1962-C5)-methyltransferase
MAGLAQNRGATHWRDALRRALDRRQALAAGVERAFRAFSGIADGVDGVFVDVYGPGAVLIVYEGRPPAAFDPADAAAVALELLRPIGVRAVYLKPFARDRSRLGGALPPVVTQPTPAAGDALPEAILVREAHWQLEVRLYDGLSTGLFLDQRDNRAFVHDSIARHAARGNTSAPAPPAVLNTFAYTCAFSVAAAVAGAVTTSVDVSARYLDWGRRNFAHNGLDPAAHWFAKMDTFEFFAYARRKGHSYDLIVLDPPSFGSGSKKKGVRPWSAEADYARLVSEAAALLRPRGAIVASTNTAALCRPGQFERAILKGLGRPPRWIDLPPAPADFAREADRFAALAFRL